MRLIDADELKKKLKETAPGLKWIFNEIDNAPTIMPEKEKIINMSEATPKERDCKDFEVLDKIISEFVSLYPKNYAGEPCLGGSCCVFSLNKVLQIIDKYKAESEGKDEL